MCSSAARDINSGARLRKRRPVPRINQARISPQVTGGNLRAMMLVLSLLLGIIPLLGVVWILTSGMITLWPFSATVDGLFMSLILLTLAGCFFLNAGWEMNDAG